MDDDDSTWFEAGMTFAYFTMALFGAGLVVGWIIWGA